MIYLFKIIFWGLQWIKSKALLRHCLSCIIHLIFSLPDSVQFQKLVWFIAIKFFYVEAFVPAKQFAVLLAKNSIDMHLSVLYAQTYVVGKCKNCMLTIKSILIKLSLMSPLTFHAMNIWVNWLLLFAVLDYVQMLYKTSKKHFMA